MAFHILALALGFLLDLAFGDPRWLYHPIRLIGNLIAWAEKPFRAAFPKSEKGELAAGTFFAVFVVAVSTAVPALLLALASRLSLWLVFALEVFWSFQILAAKSLKSESMKVYAALKEGDLPKARKAVSMIVGRDTQDLSEEGVAKAAVETVAENSSDGVIAPLLFLALGGPALGFFYKAVNTLDSMVGYKNDTYLYFGRFSAKLDDVLNFIPSRISGLLLVLASPLAGLSMEGAWKNLSARPKEPRQPQFRPDRSGGGGSPGRAAGRGRVLFREALQKAHHRRSAAAGGVRGYPEGKPSDVRGRLPGPFAGGTGGGSREPVVPDLGSALSCALCVRGENEKWANHAYTFTAVTEKGNPRRSWALRSGRPEAGKR